MCELVAGERSESSRLVAGRDGLVAISPAAGGASYELLLGPTAHESAAFGPALGSALDLLAELVRALRSVEGRCPGTPGSTRDRTGTWSSSRAARTSQESSWAPASSC